MGSLAESSAGKSFNFFVDAPREVLALILSKLPTSRDKFCAGAVCSNTLAALKLPVVWSTTVLGNRDGAFPDMHGWPHILALAAPHVVRLTIYNHTWYTAALAALMPTAPHASYARLQTVTLVPDPTFVQQTARQDGLTRSFNVHVAALMRVSPNLRSIDSDAVFFIGSDNEYAEQMHVVRPTRLIACDVLPTAFPAALAFISGLTVTSVRDGTFEDNVAVVHASLAAGATKLATSALKFSRLCAHAARVDSLWFTTQGEEPLLPRGYDARPLKHIAVRCCSPTDGFFDKLPDTLESLVLTNSVIHEGNDSLAFVAFLVRARALRHITIEGGILHALQKITAMMAAYCTRLESLHILHTFVDEATLHNLMACIARCGCDVLVHRKRLMCAFPQNSCPPTMRLVEHGSWVSTPFGI
jgi:hypothetical protein